MIRVVFIVSGWGVSGTLNAEVMGINFEVSDVISAFYEMHTFLIRWRV